MTLHIAGGTVEDPMSIWRSYASRFPRTIREYDLGGSGEPNRLTPDEAWRSRIPNSRLTRNERDQLVDRATRADCPWEGVRARADLIDADPSAANGLFDQAAALYWHFTWPDRISGVRVAKVHKVLHLKRPGLYPILDAKLRRLYRSQARPWVEELRRLRVTIQDSPPYWAAFRADLVRNQASLEAGRRELAADDNETVQSMAGLTDVRLQDIIAWSVTDGR